MYQNKCGCTVTLKCVRQVLDLWLNLIVGLKLYDQEYKNYFGKGSRKLVKWFLVIARENKCCTLIRHVKVYNNELHIVNDESSPSSAA